MNKMKVAGSPVQYPTSNIQRPTFNVILNLFQDLTEDRDNKARGQMLKQVQHDER